MTAAEGEGGGGRVLFVRLGSFSHVKASLLAALRRARPELVFEDFALRAAMPGPSLAFRKCVLGGIAEYGPGSLRSRSRLRFCVMRSAAYFNTARRLILQRAAKADYAFTVQTQTLFNAATGRCPNLIYTDHASRAREASGWDEGLGEPSARWLALESGIYRDASHVFTFGSRVRGVLVDRYGMSPDAFAQALVQAGQLPMAISDIRRQVAVLSVDIAEKVLRKNLDDEKEQMEMIDRLLDELTVSKD